MSIKVWIRNGLLLVVIFIAAAYWSASRSPAPPQPSNGPVVRSDVAAEVFGKIPLEIQPRGKASPKTMTLDALKGRSVLLHFWATWCAPCVEELPKLLEIQQRLNPAPQLVLVSEDEGWTAVKKFFEANPTITSRISTALVVRDSGQRLAKVFGSEKLPESFLLSPLLEPRFRWVGPQKWEDPRVLDEVQRGTK